MRRLPWGLILMAALLFAGCGNSSTSSDSDGGKEGAKTEERTTLTISAAVSLTDALEEMKESYEEEHPVDMTFNLGGSGTLAQQIQQGAPVDIFISANQDWMDILEEEELMDTSTREDVTGNSIVLIAGKSSSIDYDSIEDIKVDDVDQIAVGNPESVPAGQYTEEILKNLNMWDELKKSEKIVQAKDVRQVLTYVETGNADIGFVYESDAVSSDKINILTEADPSTHDPIIYPGAVTADSKHPDEAKAFMKYLQSDEAQDILKTYGFKK